VPLITLDKVSIRYRGPALFEDVSAVIEKGDRIGLLGRNGAGKTTLLKMLAGELAADSGRVLLAPAVCVTRLIQDVPVEIADVPDATVGEVLTRGLAIRPELSPWEIERQLDRTLNQLSLDRDALFSALSSGMKRRVLLGASVIAEPDVLLLDEPTNHLDIEAICALEDFLSRYPGTFVFITHDRSFLQRLANRIWEIDRGRLLDWPCDYPTFQRRKAETIQAEERQQALFDKRLAQEEAWVRQGIKARRTRNEGRVRALKKMREERQARRQATGLVKLEIQSAARSGMLVADLEDVTFARGERKIVDRFSTTIMRGDKVGIIGPNGAGKTTLLQLLLGTLPPDSGKIRLGTNLQLAYFDQTRDSLDEEKTVQENVGDGADRLLIDGQPRHVLGYLQDFLFTPERARTEVKFLSGGERNRVLLAKLMTKPANVLVLDEPTNDLDSETLELLESQIVQFSGTVLVVSHDRTFLNHVVSSTLVFEENQIHEYVGGYDDWVQAVSRRRLSLPSQVRDGSPSASAPRENGEPRGVVSTSDSVEDRASASGGRIKLGFKEKRELDSLPKLIEALESQIAQQHAAMSHGDFYRRSPGEISADQERLSAIQAELDTAYRRWEELESRAT